jgi:hypothetical protein
MASSQLQVCNLALGRLGASAILDINAAQKEAQACKLFYQTALDEVLRTHPWNFAVRRQTLTAESEDPSFGWTNAYVLPSDCLRVLDLNDLHESADPPHWQIEGRSLLCDQDEAHIRYITRDADPTHYDALFVAAFAAKLSALIAKITEVMALRNQLAEYESSTDHASSGTIRKPRPRPKRRG